MEIYWLEQSEQDLPAGNDWLSASEISFLDGLRFGKRRADWRLGRWTCKRGLAAYWNAPFSHQELAKTEIRPAPSGAPEPFFEDKLASATMSLSHSNNRALCVVAPPTVSLGCDLEQIEPRSEAFLADYFTAEEQLLITCQPSADRPLLLALLWSAKESALKALRAGLRLDTRSVAVEHVDLSFGLTAWSPLQVRHNGQLFRGWWQSANQMVRTVVAAPPPAPPIPLKIAGYSRKWTHSGLARDVPVEERVSTTES